MQAAAPRENPQKIPAALTIVGCIIAIVGAVMDWGTIGGSASAAAQTEPGTQWSAGLGTLGLAVITIILAAIMFAKGRSSGGGRGLAIAALVIMLIALFASAYSAFAPEAAALQFEKSDIAEAYGISEAQAEVEIQAAFDDGRLEVTAETGAYIAAVGSLLAAIGALMGIMAAKKGRTHAAGPGDGHAAAVPPAAQAPGHQAVAPDQGSTAGAPQTGRPLGTEGPGTTGPGTPQVGGSTPADATGATQPPHGTPPGGPDARR